MTTSTTLPLVLVSIFFTAHLLPPPSWAAPDSTLQAFNRCLDSHSNPSFPASAVVYTPDNFSYSSVLQAYIRNLRFSYLSTPKPLLILTALHESHIQAAIVCGRTHGLQMKIRSGGHDYEGISYWSQVSFFILDLFNLRSINVDIDDETAWVQAGATVGELCHRIAEKSKTHGFPVGICPTLGVGGHFSAGGYGNMMRKYGLTVDNIVDAQIIDVNGRLLDRESMGEDLFWAITGGGGSSYGVVLSYKIKLVAVPETVTVFKVERTLEQNGTALVHRWTEVADKLDEDLFIRLKMKVVDSSTAGEKTIKASFITLFLGDSQRLLSVMNQSFPELGVEQSNCKEMSWNESVLHWAKEYDQSRVDSLLSREPQISHLKRKSDYLTQPIPKEGLEFIWKKMIELEEPELTFNPYGGKMAEISPSAKPFPHRAGNICKIQYATNWNKYGEEAANYYVNLTRKLHEYMTPFVSKFPRKAYLNYRDLDLGINHNGQNSFGEAAGYGFKYFMGNYMKLVEIKSRVDPDNFFTNEQSIPLAPY